LKNTQQVHESRTRRELFTVGVKREREKVGQKRNGRGRAWEANGQRCGHRASTCEESDAKK